MVGGKKTLVLRGDPNIGEAEVDNSAALAITAYREHHEVYMSNVGSNVTEVDVLNKQLNLNRENNKWQRRMLARQNRELQKCAEKCTRRMSGAKCAAAGFVIDAPHC